MKQEETTAVLDQEPETTIVTHSHTRLPKMPTPRVEDVSGRKPIVVRFKVDKDNIRQLTIPQKGNRRPVTVHIIMPNLANWQGRMLPDSVNPRSHPEECLKSAVAKDIHATLMDKPEDFVFANRGLTIIASSVKYDTKTHWCEMIITNPDTQGVADGATTDAVIGQVQTELAREILDKKDATFVDLVEALSKGTVKEEDLPATLREARVGLQVFERLDDHDRVATLAQGRNTSRQVKGWSMANFRGEFDWLSDILEDPKGEFKGKVGYEENSPEYIKVLDVIAVLTLFHPEFNEEDQEGLKAPVIAYASKGRIDKRLEDKELRKGYIKLRALVPDILKLWEYVIAHFEEQYEAAFGKSARLGSREGVVATHDNPIELPLTGLTSNFQLPAGYIFPLLAAFRSLIIFGQGNTNAKWAAEPFQFFDKHGYKLIKELMAQVKEAGGNPNQTGKKRLAYTALYDKASLALRR
jgi:hypothetical protein